MQERTGKPLSGRRAQAVRNDQRILEAGRAVFLADPDAPISAVAKHAGVGISAIYSRYSGKEELLRTLCHEGLSRFVTETETALRDDRDPWTVFADYMGRIVDADTSSLTLALAGTFTPTDEMFALAERANELMESLFDRIRGTVREDLAVHDLSLVWEAVAAIRTPDPGRTNELRRRYLTVILDGIRSAGGTPLPGPPPSWQEMNDQWTTGSTQMTERRRKS